MSSSEDLVLSARTREISGYVSPRRTPRVHAEDLDDETAAEMLQGAWRAKIARRKLKAMARRQYKSAGTKVAKSSITTIQGLVKVTGRGHFVYMEMIWN